MSKRASLSLPIKWFSIPQCWRYERMSLGRKREHYQWNMDIWGVKGCEAEMELLCAMVSFFKRVGFTSNEIAIKVKKKKGKKKEEERVRALFSCMFVKDSNIYGHTNHASNHTSHSFSHDI
jgi:histidyl-tRNA synthetase